MAKRITAMILAAVILSPFLSPCSASENGEKQTKPPIIEQENAIHEDNRTL